MRIHILLLFTLLVLLLHACFDNRYYYTYLDPNYAVDYPKEWQVKEEDDGLLIAPNDHSGNIKIANYPTTDRPLEKMKAFILGFNNSKDSAQSVKMVTRENVTTFDYEYINNDVKQIIKVIRKDNNFHLLHLSCPLNKWDTMKPVFLHIIESFHFRDDR